MGVKASIEEKRKPGETIPQSKEDIYRGGRIKDHSFTEITNNGGKKQDTVWMDISDCIPKGDLGMLKYGVVGRWKS